MPTDGQGALHGTAVGRDRRALRNDDVDHEPRQRDRPVFVGIKYFDGQGLMVPKALGVKSAKELNGASVCVQTGTTTELNLADYFRANSMTYKPVVFEKLDEVNAAYQAGRCDVYTTDQSSLYSIRVRQPKPDDHVVLPEIISKEPLGPSVRQGDFQWFTRQQVGVLRAAQCGGSRRHRRPTSTRC